MHAIKFWKLHNHLFKIQKYHNKYTLTYIMLRVCYLWWLQKLYSSLLFLAMVYLAICHVSFSICSGTFMAIVCHSKFYAETHLPESTDVTRQYLGTTARFRGIASEGLEPFPCKCFLTAVTIPYLGYRWRTYRSLLPNHAHILQEHAIFHFATFHWYSLLPLEAC